MFESTVDRAQRGDDEGSLVLRWPSQVHQLQRRAFERSSPPPDTIVAVRFWRARPGHERDSSERDVRHGQLEDISAGGMRIKVARPEDIEDDGLYCCTFVARQGKPPFLVDAQLRHREAAEGNRASLGFQFVGLEATAEGRRTLDRLARLVSHFQRAAARSRN
jgi:c-di-GMP-binding flagellar brake protein YcgR